MAVIEELIRLEYNGTLSFGDYVVENKKKVSDFEVEGNLYYIKSHKEVTKLEKNGKLLFEAIPGVAVHNFTMDEKTVNFIVEGTDDIQITMELEPTKDYRVLVDDVIVGNVKANLSGKVTFSVDVTDNAKEISIEKVS